MTKYDVEMFTAGGWHKGVDNPLAWVAVTLAIIAAYVAWEWRGELRRWWNQRGVYIAVWTAVALVTAVGLRVMYHAALGAIKIAPTAYNFVVAEPGMMVLLPLALLAVAIIARVSRRVRRQQYQPPVQLPRLTSHLRPGDCPGGGKRVMTHVGCRRARQSTRR